MVARKRLDADKFDQAPSIDLDTQRRPLKEILDPKERELAILDMLVDRIIGQEGKSPNFYVDEFELATLTQVVRNADFKPDRWVIYFRTDANVTLRVFPGDYAPDRGSVEIENGRYAVLENVGNRVSFHNSGSATAHIFAIAIGGGAAFAIGSI